MDVLEAAADANASFEEAMTEGSDRDSSEASASDSTPSWPGIVALALPWLAAALLALATSDQAPSAAAVGAAPPAEDLHAVRAAGEAGVLERFETAVPGDVGGETEALAPPTPSG